VTAYARANWADVTDYWLKRIRSDLVKVAVNRLAYSQGPRDEQRQQPVRRHEVGVQAEPKDM